MNSFKKQ